MSGAIEIAAGVVVPADAVEVHAVRSGGPGGQNVNKVASKIDLRVDLDRIVGLDAQARARLLRLAGNSLDADGRLYVTSQLTRDQQRNLDDARDKVRALVTQAMVRPRRRRPTRPSKGAVERRISDKKQRSSTKKQRRRDDE